MLVSLNWLKNYVNLENLSIEELEKALTMIGQEVEKIEIQGENLDNVITAQILEKELHPDSDHLSICKVDTGSEILQVICGASNHKSGDKVVLAKIGAKLSEDFVIKKGKIRGVESFGMLCSEEELGIGTNSDGIMILSEDTEIGIPMKEYLNLNDVIFELEITPNRPDCLSHIGIARELAAYYKKDLNIVKVEDEIDFEENIDINIEENTSKKYMARLIKNVKVGASPKWLKEKLEAVGIRSINNIVDISNYVMLETNQPSHIFDYDKLNSKNISVRYAKDNESLITLDEKERILSSEDIVVSNSNEIIAIAGIMGSKNTEVDENTKNILIEIAHFDNISIRKTSRKLALSSESSYRFERNIDRDNMDYVMYRITNLIKELSGGEVSNISNKIIEKQEDNICDLSIDRMNRFIGKNIEKEIVIDLLTRLGVKVKDNVDILTLKAPSHRKDLVDQFDYFEEIIRLYGFDNIENIMPSVEISKKRIVDSTKYISDIKVLVASLGLRELINYSFIPKDALNKIYYLVNKEDIIEIKNPITEDFAILRPTLMYSLLKNIKDNTNRGIDNIKIFEVSKRFSKEEVKNVNDYLTLDNKAILEKETLAIALAGIKNKNLFNPKPENYDFYDLKGIIEALFEKLGFSKYRIVRSENRAYHPGRSVDVLVGNELIATFGNLHPDLEESMNIEKEKVVFAEIYLDLLKKYVNKKVKYKPLSKYQAVSRDIAVVVDKNILVGDMLKTIEKVDKLIQKVELFDIYSGLGIEINKKSVAINILLRDDNKTLEENEINTVVSKVLEKLEKTYGAILR